MPSVFYLLYILHFESVCLHALWTKEKHWNKRAQIQIISKCNSKLEISTNRVEGTLLSLYVQQLDKLQD
jgi:hypothetical protein